MLLRPYEAHDLLAVRALIDRLSPGSRLFRFHGPIRHISDDLLSRVVSGHAIVAVCDDQLVGLANYIALRDPTVAEVAFAVDDAQQGRGIGTLLFERLATDAREDGVTRFIALVLATNYQMNDLLAHLGFTTSRHLQCGELEYEIKLTRRVEIHLRRSVQAPQRAAPTSPGSSAAS